MAADDAVYLKLSEKIGVVGYPRYIEILKNQMTLEETELAVFPPSPIALLPVPQQAPRQFLEI